MSEAAGPLVEPLLLLGETRRALLRQTLSACIESWRDGWSTAREAINLLLAEDAEDGTARTRSTAAVALVGESAAQGTLIHLQAGCQISMASLGMTESGVSSSVDASQGIARELHLEMLRCLCSDLLKAGGIRDVTMKEGSPSGPPAGFDRQRSLRVAVRFGAARAQLNLTLAARLVELLVPRKVVAATADSVARRRNAITDEPVRVEAVLGDVDVALSDLAQLSEGHVIVLDHPLAETGRLTLPDGRWIANISLGSAHTHRAVSVTK